MAGAEACGQTRRPLPVPALLPSSASWLPLRFRSGCLETHTARPWAHASGANARGRLPMLLATALRSPSEDGPVGAAGLRQPAAPTQCQAVLRRYQAGMPGDSRLGPGRSLCSGRPGPSLQRRSTAATADPHLFQSLRLCEHLFVTAQGCPTPVCVEHSTTATSRKPSPRLVSSSTSGLWRP